MRKKSNLLLLILTVGAVFLLSGCGGSGEQKAKENDTQSASTAQSPAPLAVPDETKDYAEAINIQISQNDGYVKINFPFTTVEKYKYLYINNMCEALVKKGILAVTATEKGENRPINTYALTPEGQQYFTPNKGLKFADVSVERIVKITDVGIQNIKEVRFTYKLDNIAPWANLPKSDSPSQLLDVIEGNKKAEHLAQIFVVNGELVVDKARVFNPSTDGDFARSQYEGYK